MPSYNLHEMIENLYGIKTTTHIDPIAEEVNIAVTQILASNPKRVGLIIMNLSANAMYVSPENNPTAARGIYLAANGGSMTMIWDRDFETCTLPWYGIATANNSDVFVMEVVTV